MKKLCGPIAVFVAIIIYGSGCPPPPPIPIPLAGEFMVMDQLLTRRHSMNPMEVDVKFMFPEGTFLTSSLEGHAAYRLDTDMARLRVAAVGPLGAISLDLLVERNDFLVRLPGYTEPLGQEALCVIYGDSPLIRTPTILARRPGLFFGGLPDGLDNSWPFEEDEEGKWLVSPDEEGTRYLLKNNPAVVQKAILCEEGIGMLVVDMNRWEDSPAGPLPTRITTRFDGRVLFSMKVRNWIFGNPLPENVFKMKKGKRATEM